MEGNGPGNTQCLPEIMQISKDQEIQEWGCLVRSSEALKENSKVKDIFGEEYYFKLNLPFKYLKSWIQLRRNCLPVHREQRLKKNKGTNGKGWYCGKEDKKLAHFLMECQELESLRDEIWGDHRLVLLSDIMKSLKPGTICKMARYVEKAGEAQSSPSE